MERAGSQRWTSKDVARLIGIFEGDRRFFEEVLTLLPVPVATLASDGAILSANNAFLQEFHLRREELEIRTLPGLIRSGEWAAALAGGASSVLRTATHLVHLTPHMRWEQGAVEWAALLLPLAVQEPAPAERSSPAVETIELEMNAAATAACQRLSGRVTHEANNLLMIAAGYGREIMNQLPPGSPLRDDMKALLEATDRIQDMAVALGEFSRSAREEIRQHSLRDVMPQTGFRVSGTVPDAIVEAGAAALGEAFAGLSQLGTSQPSLEVAVTPRAAVFTCKGFGLSAEGLLERLEPLNKPARENDKGARDATLTCPRLLRAGVRWRVTDGGDLEIHVPLASGPKTDAARTALVVDDQPGIRNIVRRILEQKGYRVVEAASGEEANSLLDRRAEAVDLLITDMRMSGMTGRDLADRVRHRHPQTRILFISGYTDDPNVQAGILPERAGFLSKPFHPEQLGAAVDKLMR